MGSRSAGVRRLLKEAAEMSTDLDASYSAAPLEDDLFSWHFTIKGPGGDFEGGIYHGRIQLPPNYPFAPPEIVMLTQSGRFEVNKKICLSISSFHAESWQPSWGIRTALIALMAFFATEPKGAIGSLDTPPEERRRLATLSREFSCPTCGFEAHAFAHAPPTSSPAPSDTLEAAEVAVEKDPIKEEEEATPIFPSPRAGMTPSAIGLPNGNPSPNIAVGSVGGGAEIQAMPPPALPAARPIQQPAPAIVVRQAPRLIVATAGTGGGGLNEGGSPLLVDRAILVVLVALLALVVNRIA